ncbi:hypothetical protein ScPMuIL_008644 [Solemya velum]
MSRTLLIVSVCLLVTFSNVYSKPYPDLRNLDDKDVRSLINNIIDKFERQDADNEPLAEKNLPQHDSEPSHKLLGAGGAGRPPVELDVGDTEKTGHRVDEGGIDNERVGEAKAKLKLKVEEKRLKMKERLMEIREILSDDLREVIDEFSDMMGDAENDVVGEEEEEEAPELKNAKAKLMLRLKQMRLKMKEKLLGISEKASTKLGDAIKDFEGLLDDAKDEVVDMEDETPALKRARVGAEKRSRFDINSLLRSLKY